MQEYSSRVHVGGVKGLSALRSSIDGVPGAHVQVFTGAIDCNTVCNTLSCACNGAVALSSSPDVRRAVDSPTDRAWRCGIFAFYFDVVTPLASRRFEAHKHVMIMTFENKQSSSQKQTLSQKKTIGALSITPTRRFVTSRGLSSLSTRLWR